MGKKLQHFSSTSTPSSCCSAYFDCSFSFFCLQFAIVSLLIFSFLIGYSELIYALVLKIDRSCLNSLGCPFCKQDVRLKHSAHS